MAEIDLAKGFQLISDLIGSMRDELFSYVNETMSQMTLTETTTDEAINRVKITLDYNTEAEWYLMRAIYRLLPSEEKLIEILYQRQLRGLNSENQQIGKYGNGYISREYAEEVGLPWFVEGEKHRYSNYKYQLHGGKAQKKSVDLNLTETMKRNYNNIRLTVKNGECQLIFESSVPYYSALVAKYGEEAFTLTIEQAGLTWTMIDEEVGKIFEKEMWG